MQQPRVSCRPRRGRIEVSGFSPTARDGEWRTALGKNLLVAFMYAGSYNLLDDPESQNLVRG
jgi:DNA-directed RNA polymerase beta subunit